MKICFQQYWSFEAYMLGSSPSTFSGLNIPAGCLHDLEDTFAQQLVAVVADGLGSLLELVLQT